MKLTKVQVEEMKLERRKEEYKLLIKMKDVEGIAQVKFNIKKNFKSVDADQYVKQLCDEIIKEYEERGVCLF